MDVNNTETGTLMLLSQMSDDMEMSCDEEQNVNENLEVDAVIDSDKSLIANYGSADEKGDGGHFLSADDHLSSSKVIGMPSAKKIARYDDTLLVEDQTKLDVVLDNHLHIYDLNDDCIYEIMRRLSVKNVLELLGVFNERFDEIIEKRLAVKQCFRYCFRDEYKYKYSHLLLFGKYVKAVHISVGYSIQTVKVLRLLCPLMQNCQHLTSLTLNFTEFDQQYIKFINTAAEYLENLNLDHCLLSDYLLSEIIRKCRNLKKLSIIGNNGLAGRSLMHLNLNIIKELILEENDHWIFNVKEFVQKNPNIYVTFYSKYRATKTEFNKPFSHSRV